MVEHEPEVQYLVNVSTGVTHLTLILDGVRFTAEQCNVDQIGSKEVTDTPTETLCQHCFRTEQ